MASPIVIKMPSVFSAASLEKKRKKENEKKKREQT